MIYDPNDPQFDLLELFLTVCMDLQRECLADVADKAGCHPTTLRAWRDGRTVAPKISTLFPVATALGYRIKWWKGDL